MLPTREAWYGTKARTRGGVFPLGLQGIVIFVLVASLLSVLQPTGTPAFRTATDGPLLERPAGEPRQLVFANSTPNLSLVLRAQNGSQITSAPCGTGFGVLATLLSEPSGSGISGVEFNVSTSFGGEITLPGSLLTTNSSGMFEFGFITPTVLAPAVDRIAVTGSYHDFTLAAEANLTVSVEPFPYSLKIYPEDLGQDVLSSVSSGQQFFVLLELMAGAKTVGSFFATVYTSGGELLAEGEASPYGVYDLQVTAPTFRADTQIELVATATEYGLTVAATGVALTVQAAPLSDQAVPWLFTNGTGITGVIAGALGLVVPTLLAAINPGSPIVMAEVKSELLTRRWRDEQPSQAASVSPQSGTNKALLLWNSGAGSVSPESWTPAGQLRVVHARGLKIEKLEPGDQTWCPQTQTSLVGSKLVCSSISVGAWDAGAGMMIRTIENSDGRPTLSPQVTIQGALGTRGIRSVTAVSSGVRGFLILLPLVAMLVITGAVLAPWSIPAVFDPVAFSETLAGIVAIGLLVGIFLLWLSRRVDSTWMRVTYPVARPEPPVTAAPQEPV